MTRLRMSFRTAAVRTRGRLSAQGGVTLVELMVVAGLLAVTGTIVASGLVSAMQVTRHAESRVQALTDIHNTIANVSREVRAADSRGDFRPGTEREAALLAASPELLETDVRRDGARIRLTYTVAGGVLTERQRVWNDVTADPSSTTPASDRTRVLIDDLENTSALPVFAYRRGDGACVTGCTAPDSTLLTGGVTGGELESIREVTLTIRRGLGEGRQPLDVVTRVLLRNA